MASDAAETWDVFLSYAYRDGAAAAGRLYTDLSARGLRVWWDKGGGIAYGQAFDVAIQEGIRHARHYVILYTPAATERKESFVLKELAYALELKKQPIPLMISDCVPPVQIITANYIDGRISYARALETLVLALTNEARTGAGWRAHGEPAYEQPPLFIGRDDLLVTFNQLLGSIGQDHRLHVVYGTARIGKTALLRQIQAQAALHQAYVLFADCAGGSEGEDANAPLFGVVNALWPQALAKCAAVAHSQRAMGDEQSAVARLLWLRDALYRMAAEKPVVLLIDNLHLESSGALLDWLWRVFRTGRICVIASHLQSATTPPIDRDKTHTAHSLSALQPRDFAALFSPRNLDLGYDIHDTTGGEPELAGILIDEWLAEGTLRRNGDVLVASSARLEQPDVWGTRIEAELAAAAESLELDYETDALVEWLTCAAVESTTFSEAILTGATAEDIAPADTAALLRALAHRPRPILVAAPNPFPFDTPCWRLRPPGLRALLLAAAHPSDVAHYGVAVFNLLERAAHPEPFLLRARLLALARQSLEAQARKLIDDGMTPQAVGGALAAHPAMAQAARYAGYAEREGRIALLRVRLHFLEGDPGDDMRPPLPPAPPIERWHVWRDLGIAMYGYETRQATAEVFDTALALAIEAKAENHRIANLYYWRSTVADAPMPLLQEGWRWLFGDDPARTPGSPELMAWIGSISTGISALSPERRVFLRDTAALLNRMGAAYDIFWRFDAALEHLRQALALACAIGDKREEAFSLSYMGAVYRELRQDDAALAHLQQALALDRTLSDKRSEATTLSRMGKAYRNLRQYDAALDHLGQALALLRAVGDQRGEAITLSSMGDVYRALHQNDAALAHYQQALALDRAVGDKRDEAITLHSMGDVYRDLQQFDAALAHLGKALALAHAVNDQREEAITLFNTGDVYRDLRQFDTAFEYYEQGLLVLRDVNDPQTKTGATANLYFLLNKAKITATTDPAAHCATARDLLTRAQHLFAELGIGDAWAKPLADMQAALAAACGE
jgi:tetratricopeptide (TPR) repeat protein